jgi:GntR family transcriptional regulator
MADATGPVVRSTLTEQVTSRLRAGVNDGTFPPGQLMPSEGEMVKLYGVSRNVVRDALSALRGLGLIYTINGVGSYPRELRPPVTITRTNADPWDALIPTDDDPVARRAYADAYTATVFNIPEDEMLFITERTATREQTGQKVMTQRAMPVSAFDGIKPHPMPLEMHRAELIELFARHHGPLTEAETFRPLGADPDQAATFGVHIGAPLAELTRQTSAADGRLLMTESEISNGAATLYRFVYPAAPEPVA